MQHADAQRRHQQVAAALTTRTLDTNMDQLVSWATSQGAVCKVSTHPDRPRTLFASENIAPGDVVFSIPCEMLISGYAALHDEQYGKAFRCLLDSVGGPSVLDQRSLLVLLLLLERCKGQNSHWAEYVDMLPQQYDDPFWWSDHDLQLLQGTRLQQAVQHYSNGIQQLHHWIQQLEQIYIQQQQQQQQDGSSSSSSSSSGRGGTLSQALEGWGSTLVAVKWARSAVWSRAFTIRDLKTAAAGSSSSSGVVALVPVLDMCDHHLEQRVTWRVVDQQQQQQQQQHEGSTQQQQRQVFQFTTLKPMPKGTELFNNYGTSKSNEELLLGYGFVLDHNPHDVFTATISHRGDTAAAAWHDATAAAAASTGGADRNHAAAVDGSSSSSSGAKMTVISVTDREASCDESAVWQQRLSVMAAAALKLEVPISMTNPLPHQLLDVLLLAAAVPPWQLHMLLPLLPDPAAAAAAGNGDHEASDSTQQQQQQRWLFGKAPVNQQLIVLQNLNQQLTLKLGGMLPMQQIVHMLDPANVTVTRHSRLAAVYVRSQHQILTAALAAVAAATAQVIEAAVDCMSLAAGVEQQQQQQQHDQDILPAVQPMAAGAMAAAGCRPLPHLPACELGPRFEWCDHCETISTGGSSSSSGPASINTGPASSSSVPTGSSVLQVPLSCCLVADHEQQLIVQLMLAAAAAGSRSPEQQMQQDAGAADTAADYFARCWQQQQQQQRCGSVSTHLPWWLESQYQPLVEILEDTPAGQAIQSVADQLQEDFQQFVADLQKPWITDGGSSSSWQQQQQQLVETIGSDQRSSFKYFCWARQLVSQATTKLLMAETQQGTELQRITACGNAADHHQQQQQQQQQEKLLIVLGLQSVPQGMRSLLFDITISNGGSGNILGSDIGNSSTLSHDDHQQQQQQQQQQQPTVLVSSACDLPAGLRISVNNPNLLVRRNTQQMLVDHGPLAVSAAAAAAATHQQQQLQGQSAAAAAVCGDHPVPQQQQQQQQGLDHVHEITICPPDSDPMFDLKLRLLAVTGLGLSHYLLLPPHQQQQQQLERVLAAMAISMCDDSALLTLAVVQQITKEKQKAVAGVGGTGTAAAAAAAVVSCTAAMMLEEPNPAAAAARDAGRSSSNGGKPLWQQLQGKLLKRYGKACRQQLLQVLRGDKQAVAAALQQLGPTAAAAAAAAAANFAQVADISTCGSSSGCCCCSTASTETPATAAAAAVDGVHLYLTGLQSVLSAWIDLVKQYGSSSSSSSKGRGSGGSSTGRREAAESGGKSAKKKKKQSTN